MQLLKFLKLFKRVLAESFCLLRSRLGPSLICLLIDRCRAKDGGISCIPARNRLYCPLDSVLPNEEDFVSDLGVVGSCALQVVLLEGLHTNVVLVSFRLCRRHKFLVEGVSSDWNCNSRILYLLGHHGV